MKKILSFIMIIILLIIMYNVVFADNPEYDVNFKEYTPGNVGDLTYIKWINNVEVGGQNIALNGHITTSNLDSIITVTGENNKHNLIYEGKFEGILTHGLNVLKFKVFKVNTNPNIWSPGKEWYYWTIKILVTEIIISPTPSNSITPSTSITPSPTPTTTSISPSDSITPIPTPTNNKPKDIEELPKTGEPNNILFISAGLLLTLTGSIITIARNKWYNKK